MQILSLSKDAGLCGETGRGLSGRAQDGNGQRNTECCNQLKPHVAAKKTSHLHLLQNCRTRMSPGCRSVDLYCIRRGAAGANRRRGDLNYCWTQEVWNGQVQDLLVDAIKADARAARYAF